MVKDPDMDIENLQANQDLVDGMIEKVAMFTVVIAPYESKIRYLYSLLSCACSCKKKETRKWLFIDDELGFY